MIPEILAVVRSSGSAAPAMGSSCMKGMCFDVLMTVETGCSKLALSLVFACT